jgi:GcrA cell cycle regulator
MWTEERIARLKELAGRNWTASQIAADLEVSRNSILGKLHRLKFNLSRNPDYVGSAWDRTKSALLEKLYIAAYPIEQIAEKLGLTVGAVRGKLERVRKARGVKSRKALPWKPAPPLGRQRIEAKPLRLTILELKPDSCRYVLGPINGIETVYCAAVSELDKPYCPEHCAVCYSA